MWTNFNIWQLWRAGIGNALNLSYNSTVLVSRDAFCKKNNASIQKQSKSFSGYPDLTYSVSYKNAGEFDDFIINEIIMALPAEIRININP